MENIRAQALEEVEPVAGTRDIALRPDGIGDHRIEEEIRRLVPTSEGDYETAEISLPYQIYDQIPPVGAGRAPSRLIIFGLVALSVLASIGFDVLTSWLRPHCKMLTPLAARCFSARAALASPAKPVHPEGSDRRKFVTPEDSTQIDCHAERD